MYIFVGKTTAYRVCFCSLPVAVCKGWNHDMRFIINRFWLTSRIDAHGEREKRVDTKAGGRPRKTRKETTNIETVPRRFLNYCSTNRSLSILLARLTSRATRFPNADCAVCLTGYGRGSSNSCHECTPEFKGGMYFVSAVAVLIATIVLIMLAIYLVSLRRSLALTSTLLV